VLVYVLLGAVALATLLGVLLSRRAFFTPEHQLREVAPTQSGLRA
jgi:ABC-type iron transport system FetAB permease component